MSARHLSLAHRSSYRFRFRGEPAPDPIELDGRGELRLDRSAGGQSWSPRGLEPGSVIPAWTPLAQGATPWGPASLAVACDVRVIEGFDRRAPARLEVIGDWTPAPADLSDREVWLRHFAWLRLRDPVRGGVLPGTVVPDRLFVSLFEPEPLAVPAPVVEPDGLLPAIEAWHRAMGAPVPVTLIATREQAGRWRGASVDGYELDVLETDEVYPAHHPGLAMARRVYPYGLDRLRYAWTDVETLRLFEAALSRREESGTIPLRLTGCARVGIARVAPWRVISFEDLGAPKSALLVQGGLLTGRAADPEPVVSPADRAWTFLTADDRREFLWFMNPGFAKDSSSPLFVSHYLPWKPRELGAGLRGERRFCIACNRCEVHCPAGLDPQHLWKCLRHGFEAEAREHGLARCLECGLCSYACPSKIELSHEFRQARGKAARAASSDAGAGRDAAARVPEASR